MSVMIWALPFLFLVIRPNETTTKLFRFQFVLALGRFLRSFFFFLFPFFLSLNPLSLFSFLSFDPMKQQQNYFIIFIGFNDQSYFLNWSLYVSLFLFIFLFLAANHILFSISYFLLVLNVVNLP